MNLYIGNLSNETTDAELRELFSEFGEVVSVKVMRDLATGVCRGFGFVEMENKNVAFDAIDNLDTTFFLGNIISVRETKKSNTPGGGGNTGFNRNNKFKSNSQQRGSRPYGNKSNNGNSSNYNNANSYNSGDNYNRDNFNSTNYNTNNDSNSDNSGRSYSRPQNRPLRPRTPRNDDFNRLKY